MLSVPAMMWNAVYRDAHEHQAAFEANRTAPAQARGGGVRVAGAGDRSVCRRGWRSRRLAERGFVAGPQECLADVWGAGDGDELPRASGAVAVAGVRGRTSLAN
jgi:hypothetical protein